MLDLLVHKSLSVSWPSSSVVLQRGQLEAGVEFQPLKTLDITGAESETESMPGAEVAEDEVEEAGDVDLFVARKDSAVVTVVSGKEYDWRIGQSCVLQGRVIASALHHPELHILDSSILQHCRHCMQHVTSHTALTAVAAGVQQHHTLVTPQNLLSEAAPAHLSDTRLLATTHTWAHCVCSHLDPGTALTRPETILTTEHLVGNNESEFKTAHTEAVQ